MLRGAIIGLGNVALNGHIPAWMNCKDFQIAAGLDPSAKQKDLFRAKLPGIETFSTLEECGSVNLDFVDICTPPNTHFAIIKKALERGLHVICEKPLVLSEKEFQTLEDLAGENYVLMTVHNWKYAPICAKITEILRNGTIGDVKHCAWYVLRNGPAVTTDIDNWRLIPEKSGGGILIDHGWHAFYLILEWLGKKPKAVHATLENRQYADLPVEDTAKVQIEFENAGAWPMTAEVFLTWASRIRRNWGVIEGTKGSINIEDNLLKVSGGGPAQSYSFDMPLSQGSHHPEWFEQVLAEFRTEIEDGKMRGNNLSISRMCLGLIERSKQSSSSKAQVPY